MSSRDYNEHSGQLAALAGRKSFLSLATNSVKLHIDEVRDGGAFLWIDPPWQFGRDGAILDSSASCPHYEEKDYQENFRMWCSRFRSARESTIQEIDAAPDGSLRIVFQNRDFLQVPAAFIVEEPPTWYDHWYFRKTEANQSPHPTLARGQR